MYFKKWLNEVYPQQNPNVAHYNYLLQNVRDFVRSEPQNAQLVANDIQQGNTKVYVIGGAADPQKMGTLRKDFDILFDRPTDMSDEAIAVNRLQSLLVKDTLHGMTGRIDPSQPKIDITAQVAQALSA